MKITPSAAALVVKGNKILMVQEEKESGHLTGIYGIPGGHVNAGELEIETAARELAEETGISAKIEDFEEFPGNYFTAKISRKDGSVVNFGWRVFYCKKFSGELKKGKQTTPYWIDIEKAREMHKERKLLPNIIEALDYYLEFISRP